MTNWHPSYAKREALRTSSLYTKCQVTGTTTCTNGHSIVQTTLNTWPPTGHICHSARSLSFSSHIFFILWAPMSYTTKMFWYHNCTPSPTLSYRSPTPAPPPLKVLGHAQVPMHKACACVPYNIYLLFLSYGSPPPLLSWGAWAPLPIAGTLVLHLQDHQPMVWWTYLLQPSMALTWECWWLYHLKIWSSIASLRF